MKPSEKNLAYKRILLKLSGEALAGDSKFGIDAEVLENIAKEIAALSAAGLQLGIVIGGGNFFRGVGKAAANMERISADHIGMLATVMNALAMQQALQRQSVPCRVQSAIEVSAIAEPFIRNRALKHLDRGLVVIFAGGTGNPLFTTDSAAGLRAIEIGADIMFKATRVDGVYDVDPEVDASAERFERLSYDTVLQRELRVMDMTAITLCREHSLPIRVLNIHVPGNLARAACGQLVGTLVTNEEQKDA